MKYGWVVHSLTDFAKSGSWGCAGSNVSVTICCAGTDTTANSSAAPTRNFLIESPRTDWLKGQMIPLAFCAEVLTVLTVLTVLRVLVLRVLRVPVLMVL